MLGLSPVSEEAERFRAVVAKKLRRRRLRWHLYAASVVVEAGLLLALTRDPIALVLLPAFALPTLVPIMLLGRIRLPSDECDSASDFEAQAAILASCFATHTYQPPGHGKRIFRRRSNWLSCCVEGIAACDQKRSSRWCMMQKSF